MRWAAGGLLRQIFFAINLLFLTDILYSHVYVWFRCTTAWCWDTGNWNIKSCSGSSVRKTYHHEDDHSCVLYLHNKVCVLYDIYIAVLNYHELYSSIVKTVVRLLLYTLHGEFLFCAVCRLVLKHVIFRQICDNLDLHPNSSIRYALTIGFAVLDVNSAIMLMINYQLRHDYGILVAASMRVWDRNNERAALSITYQVVMVAGAVF